MESAIAHLLVIIFYTGLFWPMNTEDHEKIFRQEILRSRD